VAAACRDRKLAIVYLTLGMNDEVSSIADALDGCDVLSVGADPSFVPLRTVLGFDVVSGKPKILAHLTQARRQNVEFKSDVLKLMKVFT
jgi:hypothetical protein